MPQAVRRVVATRTEHLTNELREYTRAEIRPLEEATVLVREGQDFLGDREDVRLRFREHTAQPPRKFHDPAVAGLGRAQLDATGKTPRDQRRSRLQIQVAPADRSGLTEPGTRVGEEGDQRELAREVGLGGV